jgi:hypothetical protein
VSSLSLFPSHSFPSPLHAPARPWPGGGLPPGPRAPAWPCVPRRGSRALGARNVFSRAATPRPCPCPGGPHALATSRPYGCAARRPRTPVAPRPASPATPRPRAPAWPRVPPARTACSRARNFSRVTFNFQFNLFFFILV